MLPVLCVLKPRIGYCLAVYRPFSLSGQGCAFNCSYRRQIQKQHKLGQHSMEQSLSSEVLINTKLMYKYLRGIPSSYFVCVVHVIYFVIYIKVSYVNSNN
jgi:hypothetical protein